MEDLTISKRRMEKYPSHVDLIAEVSGGEITIDIDNDVIMAKIKLAEFEPPEEYKEYPIFLKKFKNTGNFIVEVVVRDSNTLRCKVIEVDLEAEFVDGVAKIFEDDNIYFQEENG